MNILAIDTSSRYLSLAICINDEEIFETFKPVDNKHSDYVLPEIEQLLVRANCKISQVESIAYNQGPGSFTGLRVGLSVALGLAFGIDAKLIPIPSFALHASAQYEKSGCLDKQILVGLDARLGDIYVAGLNMPDLDYFMSPQMIKPEECIDITSLRVGDGFVSDMVYPNAIHLLKIAKSGRYEAVVCEDADLLYLRNKVALSLDEQLKSKKQ